MINKFDKLFKKIILESNTQDDSDDSFWDHGWGKEHIDKMKEQDRKRKNAYRSPKQRRDEYIEKNTPENGEFDWNDFDFYWEFGMKDGCLDKEFIDKYHDKLNWEHLSRCQQLDKETLEQYSPKYGDKMNWRLVKGNNDLTDEEVKHYQELSKTK